MNLFSKSKDNRFRRLMKKHLTEQIERINSNIPHEELVQTGPNIFHYKTCRGKYFFINDDGVVEGAIYCSNYRDVITVGLDVKHADVIQATVFHDAIEGRGIFPLQTMEGSMPDSLRDALGFVGPEKDEFTTAKRWVIREK